MINLVHLNSKSGKFLLDQCVDVGVNLMYYLLRLGFVSWSRIIGVSVPNYSCHTIDILNIPRTIINIPKILGQKQVPYKSSIKPRFTVFLFGFRTGNCERKDSAGQVELWQCENECAIVASPRCRQVWVPGEPGYFPKILVSMSRLRCIRSSSS